MQTVKVKPNRLCKCGCGKPVNKIESHYILGHATGGAKALQINKKVFEEITGMSVAEWNELSAQYGREYEQ